MSTPSADELRALYVDHRLSTRAIGARFGVAHITVRRWLANYGIPIRPLGSGLVHRGEPVPDRAELERMIYVERLTYRQVASKYGADGSAVPYWLDRLGIPRPSRTRIDPHYARQLYDAGASAASIAEELGCSKTTILKFLRRLNAPRRAEGWRSPLAAADGTMVRSTYERRVADWLYTHGVAYEYEPRVPFGHGNTRADFLANGWYVEIWGVHSNDKYKRQKAAKRRLYAQHRLPLIELSPHHFSRDRHIFEQRMRKCLAVPS